MMDSLISKVRKCYRCLKLDVDRQCEMPTALKKPRAQNLAQLDFFITIFNQFFVDLDTVYRKEAEDCGFQGLDRTQVCSCTSLANQQDSHCPLITYWNFI